jgi:hypothetical protein
MADSLSGKAATPTLSPAASLTAGSAASFESQEGMVLQVVACPQAMTL